MEGQGPDRLHHPPSSLSEDEATSQKVVFITGTFGEFYHKLGRGLIRSFKDNSSGELRVYSEKDCTWRSLWRPFGPFYQRRQRIAKLCLFARAFEEFPYHTVVWLDADGLVLGNLLDHVAPGKINAARRAGKMRGMVNCAGGLHIRKDRLALGSIFGLYDMDHLDALHDLAYERPQWADPLGAGPWAPKSGDQVLFNHLVSRYPEEVHWMGGPGYIFGLDLSYRRNFLNPGDPGLAAVRLRRGGSFVQEDRKVVLLSWTARRVRSHLQNGFASFHPKVRRKFLEYYR